MDLCIAAGGRCHKCHAHPQLSQSGGDDNAYTLVEIFGHNIVVACLPSSVYGTISAATVISRSTLLAEVLAIAYIVIEVLLASNKVVAFSTVWIVAPSSECPGVHVR